MGAASWTDPSGNFWLFGGYGVDCFGTLGSLNDLWEFNPTSGTWTWQSGSNTANASGSYGTVGVASATNVPAARSGAVGWTDRSGNLWLFGGQCYSGWCSDLWEFNPTSNEWTWVNGANQPYPGSYPTDDPPPPPPTNVPAGRAYAVSWTDKSGNFWLFGGQGPDGLSNDLWKFDPTAKTWTCVSGTPNTSVAGHYGVKGVASPSNEPPGRSYASGWIDSKGNLWLYGGPGLSDLWEFNPTTNEWTWVAGSNLSGDQPSISGTQGTPSDTNTPGSLMQGVSWIDQSDNLWLFGGNTDNGGFDSNQLWKFNPKTNQWVWVSGSDSIGDWGTPGNYGNIGVPSPANAPDGRGEAVGWTDKSGNFWLFAGGSASLFNDLWRYQP